MAVSPYQKRPRHTFWKFGVAARPSGEFDDFYAPKFPLSTDAAIMTAGSCFAQHIGRALGKAGVNIVDTEQMPNKVPDRIAHDFGYRLYSARYGNVYTARQLRQLFEEALGIKKPRAIIWKKADRSYDALRPGVEPEGLDSDADVKRHRAAHLAAVRRAIAAADTLVFTFGLTEAWLHRRYGTVYPTAPGTIAGSYDPSLHRFHNFSYPEIIEDFLAVREMFSKGKAAPRFIITVSPVPLAATAEDAHVEVATTHSKAVLRAVCGELARTCDDVDYFPSYEIITSQRNCGGFYHPENWREVTKEGVTTAMRSFLNAHGIGGKTAAAAPQRDVKKPPAKQRKSAQDLRCEELMLEKFAK